MHRLLALLVLLVVFAQTAYSAVAGYCRHEAEPSAVAHLGHHPHQHQEEGVASDDPVTPGFGSHPDCGTCQLEFAKLSTAGLVLAYPADPALPPLDPPLSFGSRTPDRLIRPPVSTLA
jgi:hypothetical protein